MGAMMGMFEKTVSIVVTFNLLKTLAELVVVLQE